MSSDHSLAAGYPGHLGTRPTLLARCSRKAAGYALRGVLSRIRHGSIDLTLPDGERLRFAGDQEGPHGELTVHNPLAINRLLRSGAIGFAESYLERHWDSADLPALLELVSRNREALDGALGGAALYRLLNRAYHRSRPNSRQGSRRNIAFHYDLGNAFYGLWLDRTMTYSSALFEHRDQPLEAAQRAKYRRIAELAGLKPGAEVLEIGCGWGGFMEHAAAHWGSRVLGITLSREQWRFANRRMEEQGIAERAGAALLDYRDTRGQYDAIVSIEMLEAVGEAHWHRYFQTLYQRLKPGAAAVIQVITIDDRRFARYRRHTDFIQRHIFPGGMLPCPRVLEERARQAGLTAELQQTFGASYATTLDRWRGRFLAAWPQISAKGFDQRFRRLWEYYLCYCEAGFRADLIDVGIYRFRRPR
jgi:cyclopropane-fatty-acyl-phospholipid synthase